MAILTPTQFQAQHGDPTDWTAVDFEVFQNLAQMQPRTAPLLARWTRAVTAAVARVTTAITGRLAA